MQVVNYIILGASFVTAITTICAFLKKVINKGFEPLNKKIDELDKNQCKNFLVNYLSDIETGLKTNPIRDERAHECFDRYTNVFNGNSYIKEWWNKLIK